MENTILSVRDLCAGYRNSRILDGISLDIQRGKIYSVIGPNGCGKTTLIRAMSRNLRPQSGQVLLDGKDIHSDKNFTRQARFKVGLCFQYPEYQLFENTVYEDIAFGPKNMKLSKEEIKERVLRAAEFVGVRNDMLQKSPFDLSGGEKRRVAIAGVMAMQPEILILDEPSAGLDPKGRKVISEMIEQYRKNTGSTVIVVSHSMEDVAESADKVLVMNKGKVEYFASVDEVFSNAEHLVEIGLNVPEITKVLLALKKQGYDVRTDIYSVNEAKAELLRLFKERGVLA